VFSHCPPSELVISPRARVLGTCPLDELVISSRARALACYYLFQYEPVFSYQARVLDFVEPVSRLELVFSKLDLDRTES
jgi:hypothetical protein